MTESWRNYEEVAAHLLRQFRHEFGLDDVESKQRIEGLRSDTAWEIDAKGIREGDGAVIVIECRRHTVSRLNQEQTAALAYRIIDSGAAGGIMVSPMGLQSGAKKVANSNNILEVTLDPSSTPLEFSMKFLNKFFVGLHERMVASDTVACSVSRTCGSCGNMFSLQENEQICPACVKVRGGGT